MRQTARLQKNSPRSRPESENIPIFATGTLQRIMQQNRTYRLSGRGTLRAAMMGMMCMRSRFGRM